VVPFGHKYAGCGSVYDMIQLATSKDRNCSGGVWRKIMDYNDQFINLGKYKFSGAGQKDTPVAPYNVLSMVLDAIPSSRTVVRFRIHYGEQLRDIFAKHTTMIQTEACRPFDVTYSLADSSKEKTFIYVRIRKPEKLLVNTTYAKQLTTEVLKFGIARNTKTRDDDYNRCIDNGYFAFTYSCGDRHQADIIERILIYDFSKVTVLGSREYIDTQSTALIIGCTHIPDSYPSHVNIAGKLFLYIVRKLHAIWPSTANVYGHSYEILTNESPMVTRKEIIQEHHVTQLMV
jgi:hypothetical protein